MRNKNIKEAACGIETLKGKNENFAIVIFIQLLNQFSMIYACFLQLKLASYIIFYFYCFFFQRALKVILNS